jgi:hypothetical protein
LLGEQPPQFLVIEPDKVETKVIFLQGRELNPQKLFVPTGIQRENGQGVSVNRNDGPSPSYRRQADSPQSSTPRQIGDVAC